MAADSTYRILGRREEPDDALGQDAVQIRDPRRLVPGRARDAEVDVVDVHADEVVRMELNNGFVLWSRAEDLLHERGRRTATRSGVEAWEIDPLPRSTARDGTRGIVGIAIKVLDFFGVELGGKAARTLGERWEKGRLEDGGKPENGLTGLYHCSMGDEFQLTKAKKNELLSVDHPFLVFIHGTGSSCRGSFGKLWDSETKGGKAVREILAKQYPERVYSFEHLSLSHSPITNALELAKRLPKAAELHLVTHSRGGLVGELLCLGEREASSDPLKPDLIAELFRLDRVLEKQIGLGPLDGEARQARDAAYADDRKRLVELLDLLAEKRFRIRRFVRCACPARGTTLASGRLDRWLSMLDFVGNATGVVTGGIVDFILAVIRERTDPRTLPGLEAMMPGSALTRLLHHPDLVTASDLTVIAGDIEGDSLLSQLKLFVTDWFYGADHDLVVNTGSMYGGIRRHKGAARFQFDQGPGVNHASYFENARSVRWLLNGLTGETGGFRPLEEAKHEEPRWRAAVRRSQGVTRPQPLAVVLPGTMGSSLSAQGERVWLNYWKLMRGGLRKLRTGEPDIEPTDLLDDFYGPLLEYLAHSHRVEIFPYDWRLSIRESAAALTRKLEGWLTEPERWKKPVHLVAHSMGGLVVRAMIADGGAGQALWRRIIALPESRLLMLGTPNRGSYEAFRWLTGYNPTQAKLSLLDLTQSTDEIVNLVRRFPGLLELLPCDAQDPDFSEPAFWTDLRGKLAARWEAAEELDLSAAHKTWKRLQEASTDPEHMIYVAGSHRETVVDYAISDYEASHLAGRKRLTFTGTREGDGTVTWQSGRLPGVKTWYVEDTAHDELCAKYGAFAGYRDLLMTGTTTRLASTPPAKARAAADEPTRFPMPVVPPTDGIPDERAVRQLTFGPARPLDERTRGPALPRIEVCIRHGNLAYAKYPVLVGHYFGDTIVSAEKALDDRLDGALSKRLQLGLYPGRLGTHAVFFQDVSKPHHRPRGAVVIGLGQVGELTPTLLEAGVRDALLDYALQIARGCNARRGIAAGDRQPNVSCLLVGSGAGGISVRDSVQAMLRAATTANTKLAEAQLDDRVRISAIEFVELYQDVALEAAEALNRSLEFGQLDPSIVWPRREIEEGTGGHSRARCEEAQGWWHRLEILEEKQSDTLRFIATTDRARAEVTLATGQLRLADDFISVVSSSASTNSEIAMTLFEMLLPNRMKALAPRQTDLVLLVDEISARYPWELLENRWSLNGRPPAVAEGLIRQLKTQEYRAQPAHAAERKAYVVGNPDLDHWQTFPDLPGARSEANTVAQLLRERGFQVLDRIDASAEDILNGLHKDAWRILHLAGHGEHEFSISAQSAEPACITCGQVPPVRERKLSGMVIGKNTFLTAGDVEQMRWVPELVFINCCHLGKTQRREPPRYSWLAANLAVQFIRMGVKAVVAAGWAVDDAAAELFAQRFYDELLTGESFGAAVQRAREAIWMRYPNVNTWGAYQCYGDPGFRLYQGGGDRPRRSRALHSPAELIAEIRNYTAVLRMNMADQQSDDTHARERLRDFIAEQHTAIPEELRGDWLERADVAAAIGFAWGEVGGYQEAMTWLDKALAGEKGVCPLQAVEQYNNFRVRLCGQQWAALQDAPDDQDKEDRRRALISIVETSMRELDLFCQRAATTERLNLLGSACKRLAWLETEKRGRLEALVNMMSYYRRAHEKAGKVDPYPFTNLAVATILVAHLDPDRLADWKQPLLEEIEDMIETARERNRTDPNFWNTVAEADCEVARLLIEGVDENSGRIPDLYRAAFEQGTSPRQIASVREHLDFIIAVGDSLPSPVRDAISAIRATL